MALNPKQQQTLKDLGGDISNIKAVHEGHMAYHRFLMPTNDGRQYFVKAHDPMLITDPVRAAHSKIYLQKEADVFDRLNANGFQAIPQYYNLIEDMLVLEAFTPEDGWHWQAPMDAKLRKKYTAEVLDTLQSLSKQPPTLGRAKTRKSMDVFQNDGWKKLRSQDVPQIISNHLDRWQHKLRPKTAAAGKHAVKHISISDKSPSAKNTGLSHHDARQTNIAWHPEYGVRLVDMGWVHAGPHRADTTMFLIDLHKSDTPILTRHMAHFDTDHAYTLLGYWLQRSSEPHREGNEDVRFHQFVSALVAYDLLQKS